MQLENVNGCSSIDQYVKLKLNDFNNMKHDFDSLFQMMFRESDNVLYEKSVGYRITKTTYGECKKTIEAKAAVLSSVLSDLQPDSVIGIYMENSILWIETFWAILRAGFRPLLMNLRLDIKTLEKTVADLNVMAVISDGADFSVKTLRPDFAENKTPEKPISDFYGSEIFVMSSGTSSNVKVCAYSAEEFFYQVNDSFNIITECAQMKKHYKGELKQLTFLPFYHIFGLVAVYIWFAFFSRTFVHLGDLAPNTIINTVRRHNVTHIFAVPLFWNKVYQKAISGIKERGDKTYGKFLKGLRISRALNRFPLLGRAFSHIAFKEIRENIFGDSICFMISGGSEIKPEVLEFFNAIGYHLANGYGMTEIGITSVELSKSKRILNSASVGKPFASIEYKIDDSGQLFVKGKATSKYIIEKSEKRDNGDWYATGDLAEYKNGRYYILGRIDDLVISPSGENLNPNIVEPKFDGIPGIEAVCLFASKTENGAAPILLIQVNRFTNKEGFKALKEAVKQKIEFLNLKTEIKKIVFTSTAVISATDIKLNRRAIAARYASGIYTEITESKFDASKESDTVFFKVRDIFAKVLEKPAEEITEDYDFFTDGGGTSLDYFSVLPVFEEEFSVSLPISADATLSTPKEICDYIKETLNKR